MQPVEKFTPKQLQEYAVKNRLSRFKIFLQMKQPPNRQYFGAESCTLARVLNRQLTTVKFNGQRGLRNCLAIEARLRGRYNTATIYQRHPGGWAEVITFADGQQPVYLQPPAPTPAPVVRMHVVHNSYDGSVIFKQAA